MQDSKPEKMLFLFGAATQAEVINVIRSGCTEEEVKNLDTILSDWRVASSHFVEATQKEVGIAEAISVVDIDSAHNARLSSLAEGLLFRQTFSQLPFEFKSVEIGKLVAAQREVNLEYVRALGLGLKADSSQADLIEFCLAPKQEPPTPKVLQIAQNAFAFSSQSPDFRFIGGFPKPLTLDDIQSSYAGGYPVSAVILLLGYGSSTCNAFQIGKRLILNNGFHRMYTLLERGIEYAPMLVQKISNPDLELPDQVAGLPKDYLLRSPRPVIMKDFVNRALVREINRKPRLKSIQIGWNSQQSFVPI